ncbi:MAG: tRNA (adenosine(37)-N6)-dimethylallyltransferase MiaA [Pseudomonadota bacterium]
MFDLHKIPCDRPVFIAGPTASGKSELALRIAEKSGGQIINADALQVYANWNVLTARPSAKDLNRAPHVLYGHIPADEDYSAGDWLRDVTPLLKGEPRAIIVGGTGLYFAALTEGLAQIPQTPSEVRQEACEVLQEQGIEGMLRSLDSETRAKIDERNPMRVQRAWEVLQATGRGLAEWQKDTPPPTLPVSQAETLVLDAPKDWLTPRIEKRFDLMLKNGALQEVEANLSDWNPSLQSAKAIGARELIAHLSGELTLEAAREAVIVATRQYAKRQRTWFKARMREWRVVEATTL